MLLRRLALLPSTLVAVLASAPALAAPALELPATFRGDMPCADCAAIRYHLDLWPDHVFHLRREWSGKDDRRDEIGLWRVDEARAVLVLQGSAEMPLQFAIESNRELHPLDADGLPIIPAAPRGLRSDGRMEATSLSLFLGGEVTPEADALRFDECLTGRTYVVAPGAEAQKLEQEYRKHRADSGAALYVSIDGTLQPATRTLPDGRERAIVEVKRFVGAWPDQACERSRADAALENTYWRIAQMQGTAVVAAEGRREPHLILRRDGESHTFSATVGCNPLHGRWRLAARSIAFERGATTLMACPAPLAEQERRLREMLDATANWRITGNTLLLEDARGAPLALLEAVYF